MVYLGRRPLAVTQTETHRSMPVLIRAIALSKWEALALSFFLRAAWESMRFFTRCPDPRLDEHRHHAEKVLLFHLRPCANPISGVAGLESSSTFDAKYAECLLEFILKRFWRDSAEFIWYDSHTSIIPHLLHRGKEAIAERYKFTVPTVSLDPYEGLRAGYPMVVPRDHFFEGIRQLRAAISPVLPEDAFMAMFEEPLPSAEENSPFHIV